MSASATKPFIFFTEIENLDVVILNLHEIDAGYDPQTMSLLAQIDGVKLVTEIDQSILALKLEENYDWDNIEDAVIDTVSVRSECQIFDMTPTHWTPL